MIGLAALNLPKIAPSFDFPYVNVFLSIIAAVIGVVILAVLAQSAMALGSAVSAYRSGHGGSNEAFKAAGIGIFVIALLASLGTVVLAFVNWLNL